MKRTIKIFFNAIFFVGIFVLAQFAFIDGAYGVPCGVAPEGQQYAQYELRDEDNKTIKNECVLFDPFLDTFFTFEKLVDAGILEDGWKEKDANRQYKNSVGIWTDSNNFDSPANTIEFLMQETTTILGAGGGDQTVPVRYRIEADEPGDVFLYFKGIFKPEPLLQWEAKSHKDVSSILVDRGKTVKVVLTVVTTDPKESFATAGINGIICPECGGGMLEDLVMDVSVISPQERTVTLTWDTLDVDGGKYTVNMTAKGMLSGDVVVPVTFQIKEVPNCKDFTKEECKGICFYYENACKHKFDTKFCPQITDKNYCGTEGENKGIPACKWNGSVCETPVQAAVSEEYGAPEGYAGPLPTCAFSGNCRDVNKILELVVRYVQMLFGLIGSLAFVMFIFGGFTILTSFGSPEKVKKGQGVLVAAVVGILIAFGAYIMIDFVLDALQVSEQFREIQ